MMNPLLAGLGVSTMDGSKNFRDLPEFLSRADALELDFIELSLYAEEIVVGGRILPSRLSKLANVIGATSLRYTVHGPIAVNFMDVAHRELHEKVSCAFIEICHEIGAKTLVLHTGITPATHHQELEQRYVWQRDSLQRLGDFAGKLDVVLCIENVFVYQQSEHTASPAKLAREIATVDHPHVRATLDFGHARIQCNVMGLDYVAQCQQLAKFSKHLHVHECLGMPKTVFTRYSEENLIFGQGDLHLPLGWGDMQWGELLPVLQTEPDTVFMLEIATRYMYELEDSVAQARRLMRLLGAHQAEIQAA